MLYPGKIDDTITIQDIVMYSDAPTGFEEVKLLEEGLKLPSDIDKSTLILQKSGEKIYLYTHMNNKVGVNALPPERCRWWSKAA